MVRPVHCGDSPYRNYSKVAKDKATEKRGCSWSPVVRNINQQYWNMNQTHVAVCDNSRMQDSTEKMVSVPSAGSLFSSCGVFGS